MDDKKKSFRSEFVKTIVSMVTAAFALVAALAWNETIKDFINRFISPGSTFISKLIYAILVTILAVLVTYFLGRWVQETKEEERKRD